MKKSLVVIGCILVLCLMVVGCGQTPTASAPVVIEKYSGKNLSYDISHYVGSNHYKTTVRIGQPITDGLTFSEEVVGIYEARKVVDEAWVRYFAQCHRPVPKRR